jgi:hypothetical protein
MYIYIRKRFYMVGLGTVTDVASLRAEMRPIKSVSAVPTEA